MLFRFFYSYAFSSLLLKSNQYFPFLVVVDLIISNSNGKHFPNSVGVQYINRIWSKSGRIILSSCIQEAIASEKRMKKTDILCSHRKSIYKILTTKIINKHGLSIIFTILFLFFKDWTLSRYFAISWIFILHI